MRKLLIADYNEAFRLALAEALENQFQILSCADGREALSLLLREQPELLLLDLMLPEIDGITLLHRAAVQGLSPVVLATTRIDSDYVQESIRGLNISYLIMKPCEVSAIAERILDISGGSSPPPLPDPRACGERWLEEFWFPQKRRGYPRLLESILLKVGHPDWNITKHIYPEAARLCGVEAQNMERPIRLLLEYGWDHGNQALWRKYFSRHTKRPTNDEFITCLALEIRRQLEQE